MGTEGRIIASECSGSSSEESQSASICLCLLLQLDRLPASSARAWGRAKSQFEGGFSPGADGGGEAKRWGDELRAQTRAAGRRRWYLQKMCWPCLFALALRFAAVAEPRKRDFVCGAVLNRRVFIIP